MNDLLLVLVLNLHKLRVYLMSDPNKFLNRISVELVQTSRSRLNLQKFLVCIGVKT